MSGFEAKKASFSEEMIIGTSVDEVFPLLCPEREHDWIPGWNADILWSVSGLAEEGAVFRAGGQTWIIDTYEVNKKIGFVYFNPDMVTRLTINIETGSDHTKMLWTHSRTGLTEKGNAGVESMTQEAYSGSVKGMEAMMTYYLMTGNMIDDDTLKKHVGDTSHH